MARGTSAEIDADWEDVVAGSNPEAVTQIANKLLAVFKAEKASPHDAVNAIIGVTAFALMQQKAENDRARVGRMIATQALIQANRMADERNQELH